MMSNLDNSLLIRPEVNNCFRILNFIIEITLSEKDYKYAKYLFKYEIKKIEEAEDVWREVFAYKKKDLKVKYVTKGVEVPNNGNNGLSYKVTSLDNIAKNACLKLAFDKELKVGDTYSFSLKFKTKIESLSNINSFFGGDGCIWYWIANEFDCDSLEIIFNIPKKLTIKDTHPENSSIDKNTIHFTRQALSSNEFVSALVTFERKFLGLNSKYGKWIQILFNMIMGALISIGLTILLT